MNIILLGYMASGKSLIGKKLAEALHYNYIDLDAYIESEEQNSVSELFDKKGELFFRKVEHKHLNTLLDTSEKTVISLGGGTPCYYNTMALLKANENFKTIYLRVSIPELVNRLKTEKEQRPIIAHIETEELLTEFIGKHLFERSNFYNQADVTIDANENPEAIIEAILLKLF
ncbi:shikimate kinase [Pontimicrobium sp. MEBiC01747]